MRSRLQFGAATLALWTLLMPASLRAEPSAMRDVALADGGVFRGQVVDAQGQPQANVAVTLASQTGEQSQATTDQQGIFQFRNVRGGVYTVSIGGGGSAIRLWAPRTAPPKAAEAALLVQGADAVRGQDGFRSFITNPLVIAGIVATAVAVPVALHNSGGSGSP